MMLADGWSLDRSKGSHYIYKHPEKGTVVVPFHGRNAEIAPGTLRDILRMTRLNK